MPEELKAEEVQEFLVERGIESLADRPVRGHDGELMPLAQAIATCEPARTSIDSTIETIRDMGGKDTDIIPQMTKHLDRMSQKAQTVEIREPAEAEKK